MSGVIYKIENKVNGKVYVGQTRVGFDSRVKAHIWALNKNEHNNDNLQRAWNKYGEENFVASIVVECPIDKMDELERKWIAKYKKTGASYNLESGGNKRKTHCLYSRRKISKATKEAFNRPEVRKKLLEAAKRRRGANNNKARSVICINTNEVFPTLTEAAEKTGLNAGDIFKVCSGERLSAGFHKNGEALQFSYYEPGKTYTLKPLDNLFERRNIVCTNTGEVFESAAKAAEKYGLSQGSITGCCRGNIKSAGKLPNGEYSVWVYEEDFDPDKNYFFHRHLGTHNPRAKKVICITTGEIFETMKEAGEKYNISGSGCKISLACTGKRKHVGKHPDGRKLQWAYYEDFKALI